MSLQWNPELNLGETQIDAQHQHLFELTNAVVAAGSDVAALRGRLMQLYQHTREHFAYEEDLMRRLGCAGVDAHAGYHNQLLDRLNAVSANVGKGRVDLAAIEALMTDWALRHIPNDDAVIAPLLKRNALAG